MSNNTAPPIPLMEAGGVASSAFGQYTGDGSGSISIPLGFSPMGVKVFNETDTVIWEWSAGMAATHSIKTTSSATSVDTSSAIVSNHVITSRTTAGRYLPDSNGPGDGTLENVTVPIDAPDQTLPKLVLSSAACNISGKVYSWSATG